MDSPGSNLLAAPDVVRVADEYLAAHRGSAGTLTSRNAWDFETAEERDARQGREDSWLRTLRDLDGTLPIGSPDWVTHGMLRHELESGVAARATRAHLWDLNQMTGWHLTLAHVAATMAVDTPEQRESALQRFGAVARTIDARIDDLREGMAAGYTAARQAVRRVIQQVNTLLAGDALESAARRTTDERFAGAWGELIARDVRPAVLRFRDFLAGTYLPAARELAALSALPNGLEAYRAEVWRFTSLDLSPEQVLEGAEEEIAALEAELAPILERLYPGVRLEEAKRKLREDPEHTHRSRAEMIQHARAVLERVKPRLGRYFLHVPEVPLVVEPMTPIEERIGASGYYQSPENDAPGRYVLNTAHARQCGRWETTCSAVHEGYPGHHFERSYGDMRPERHPATRELQTQAFREGWAFYGEWLAREMDVYRTEAEMAGHYLHAMEVWVGLIADVLMHTGRITPAQAVTMLVRRAGRLQHASEARIDRYAAAPGHVTCYMVGYRAVRQLRRQAESALGAAFDPRAFHDLLLRNGPLTLPMQQAKVNAWLAGALH